MVRPFSNGHHMLWVIEHADLGAMKKSYGHQHSIIVVTMCKTSESLLRLGGSSPTPQKLTRLIRSNYLETQMIENHGHV